MKAALICAAMAMWPVVAVAAAAALDLARIRARMKERYMVDDFDPDGVLSALATEETAESRAEWERRCHCGSGIVPHENGKHPSCESFDHHCEECHAGMTCMYPKCVLEFERRSQ